ncbi:MAG: hypothetical protein GX767_04785 [Firmicutes bacterium]|nr:hypothetical protein [Bacillota bacterium]
MGLYYLFLIILVPVFYYLLAFIFPRSSRRSKLAVLVAGCAGSFFFPLLISFLHPFLVLLLLVFGGSVYSFFLARKFVLQGEVSYIHQCTSCDKQEDENLSLFDEAEAEAMLAAIHYSPEEKDNEESSALLQINHAIEASAVSDFFLQEESLAVKNRADDIHLLISQGFYAQQQKDIKRASASFTKAFSLATDCETKGMVCTELVFIYKELGQYEKAIDLLQSYLTFCSSKINPGLKSHLLKTIAYLQTLQDLLQKSNKVGQPFSEVSQLIKLEAEKVFHHQ